MKKLELTEQFIKTEDMPGSKKDEVEKCSRFYIATMSIINSGQIAYRGMAHYKEVRNAVKKLKAQKESATVLLEDSDYRVLFGTDDQPGFLRLYGGWLSGDSTDEYISIWEEAKVVSFKQIKEGKSEKV